MAPNNGDMAAVAELDPRTWQGQLRRNKLSAFIDPYQSLMADSNSTYGTLIPAARNNATGETRFALPTMLRDIGIGGLDALAGRQVGELTPLATGAISALPFGGAAPSGSLRAGAALRTQRAATPRAAMEAARTASTNSARQAWVWKTPEGKFLVNAGDRPEGAKLVGRAIGDEWFSGPGLMAKAGSKETAAAQAAGKSQVAPPFYSALTRSVEELPQPSAPAQQWQGILKNLLGKGVKQEELDWSGVGDWLGQQTGPVRKEDLVNYLRSKEVKLGESLRGDKTPPARMLQLEEKYLQSVYDHQAPKLSAEDLQELKTLQAQYHEATSKLGMPKYNAYVTPGGENYRELLLTLPEDKPTFGHAFGNVFNSGHYEEPNVLAHTRYNERTTPQGQKTLHLEEVQSDWHQKGRKQGYTTLEKRTELSQELDHLTELEKALEEETRLRGTSNAMKMGFSPEQIKNFSKYTLREMAGTTDRFIEVGNRLNALEMSLGNPIPDAPLKNTWHETAFRRMVREAAEKGFDNLSWTTGKQQAARYDLSKQVEHISYTQNGDKFTVYATPRGHDRAKQIGVYTADKLDDVVGKELAERIRKGEGIQSKADPRFRYFEGVDLEVGGEGMKGFYDKMLTAYAKKFGKKFNAQPVVGQINTPDGPASVHMLPITPELREAAMKGFPTFARFGPGIPLSSFAPSREDQR